MLGQEGDGMAGSKPPGREDDGAGSDGANARELASSLEQDFSSLVEIFDRLLQLTSESDLGATTALWTAHAAAKRGAQLSERLSMVANDNRLKN